jgi:hypothetical protein
VYKNYALKGGICVHQGPEVEWFSGSFETDDLERKNNEIEE